MRRLLVLALACLIVGVPAAYAASNTSSSDAATAKSLLLVKSDLPAGFVDDGSASSGSSGSCTGVSKTVQKPTAKVNGHDFKRETKTDFSEIGTEARVYASTKDSKAVLAHLFKNHAVGSCLARMLQQAFKNQLTKVQIHPIALTTSDLQMSAFDITAVYHDGKTSLPLELLAAGYQYKRAITVLIAIQGGTTNAKAVGAAASKAVVNKLKHANL